MRIERLPVELVKFLRPLHGPCEIPQHYDQHDPVNQKGCKHDCAPAQSVRWNARHLEKGEHCARYGRAQ